MYGKGGLEGSIRRVHYHVIGKRDWASGEYMFFGSAGMYWSCVNVSSSPFFCIFHCYSQGEVGRTQGLSAQADVSALLINTTTLT
jgi:hypothetical protein